MFYLGLENQIHLFIVIIFSSYIYLSSFSIRQPSAFIKHFSTAFFIPLVLCLMSFLSLNREYASSYLFFSEFILISALLLILLVQKNGDFTYVIFFLLYAMPVCIGILNLNFDSISRSAVFTPMIGVYGGFSAVLIVACMLSRKKEQLPMYCGLLAISASLLLMRLSPGQPATTIALVMKAAGYLLFSWFFYRSTTFQLQQQHSRNTSQLERLNDNVQREVNRRVEEIERSNKKLVEISKTDGLTGAYTKKAILDMMDMSISKQPDTVFSVLMFDIDNFKTINDTHGHITGDKCIKNLMNICRNSFRGDDIIGRFGGDEFVIMLPGTSPVKAYLVAERFRKNVEQTKDPHFTVSIGVASFPLDGKNSKGLISSADKALYISKEKGRNMVSHTGQLEE
ncbi:MAG: diguanylate cyclase [Thermoclostridium sp.]|nr:diguanylate cyclase [Thermoclostridium sp.]